MNASGTATIIEHLDEFRSRLIKSLLFLCIFFPLCWPFSEFLINWIVKNLCPLELGSMYYTKPMELFFLRIKVSLVLALAISVPYVAWQIWSYLSPALSKGEQKITFYTCCSSFLLFWLGGAIALFGVFPILMEYSLGMQSDSIHPLMNVSSCIEMVLWLVLGFGLCFQLPLFLLGTIQFGITSVKQLRAFRPYIVVIIFIVAALVTPPDIISQTAMAIPTWILYELSLFVGACIEKRRARDSEGALI